MKPLLPIQLQQTELFLFDLDGTLLDLEEANFESMKVAVQTVLHGNGTWDDYTTLFSGGKVHQGFHRYLVAKHLPADSGTIELLATAFREYKRNLLKTKMESITKPLPGVGKFLAFIHQRRKTIGLVTSTKREFAEMLLQHYGWWNYFAITICAEDVSEGKPDPQGYNLALAACKVAAEHATAFEDSPRGIAAAQSAGLFTIGIHTDGVNDKAVESCDAVIEDYEELIRYFH